MILNLITFVSAYYGKRSIRESHNELLSELEKYFTVNIIDSTRIDQLNKDDFSIIFITSGGIERSFSQCFEQLPRPTVLLADGLNNSLAAALEISAWIRMRGLKSEILHGDKSEIIKRLITLYSNNKAFKSLSGRTIGVIGSPAPWLIASNVDYLLTKRRWGVLFKDIPLEEVYDEFHRISEDEIGEGAASIAGNAEACLDGSPEDLIKSMRLYKAVRNIAEREHLDALTLSCFKMLEEIQTTGCLALSLLNDEGIIAGCEGDLQSVFTMLAAKVLTDKSSFMANPSMIDETKNELILSHCSIGTKLLDKYVLRNHFESQTGIAIQGILPKGDITLIKCGGVCLDEYYVSNGTLIDNTDYNSLCRTQVRIRLNTPVDYFLRSPLGNHHIMLCGNHAHIFNEFMQSNGSRRIE